MHENSCVSEHVGTAEDTGITLQLIEYGKNYCDVRTTEWVGMFRFLFLIKANFFFEREREIIQHLFDVMDIAGSPVHRNNYKPIINLFSLTQRTFHLRLVAFLSILFTPHSICNISFPVCRLSRNDLLMVEEIVFSDSVFFLLVFTTIP